jgi:hypothetical protein
VIRPVFQNSAEWILPLLESTSTDPAQRLIFPR